MTGPRPFRFSRPTRACRGIGLSLCLAGFAMVQLPGTALAGKPQPNTLLPGANSKDPIQIEATKLDYFDREHKLVYTGNVVATQGTSKLKASTLVIFLVATGADETPGIPSSSSEVRRMEAEGPVTLTSKDQIGTGDRGIFEKSENKVYLIGNVTLSEGPNVTVGDKLVYDLTTNRAIVTGRVKSMFVPKEGKPAAPRR
jgi:lipopolysaccharide export system protein LptA